MNNKAFLLMTLIFLGSCAHKKAQAPAVATKVTVEPSVKKAKEIGKTRAIFHVIQPLGIELLLQHSESNKREKLLIDKTLSQIGLSPGHWQVTGFILKGKQYKVMNSSKSFNFYLRSKKFTYVGSYIFQCPKVGAAHLQQMKKMNFFNRYPFSSQEKLCELVVGSDFENVNRVWLKLNKTKHPSLSLGF